MDMMLRPIYWSNGNGESLMGLAAGTNHNERYLAPPDLRQDLARRTAKGGFVGIVAQGIRLVLQIGGTAVLSRLLSPSDFGLVALAATVTVFMAMFTDMGLSGATIQRHEIDQQLVSTLLAINIGIGLLLWLVACLVAPAAGWFFEDPAIAWLIVCVALAIPLTAAGAQHNALLIRTMQWTKVQSVPIIGQFVGLALAIVLLLTAEIGYWALAVQQVAAALASLAMLWTLCRWRPSWPLDVRAARQSIAFGGYVTGANVVNYFHRQGDNLLIGWRWGTTELGYYSRGYNLLTLPISIIQSTMSSIAVPALSRIQHDEEAWNAAFLKLICVSNLLGIGLCAVIFAVAEPLILLVLGAQWKPVVPIFQLLALSSVMATSSNCMSWVFLSRGQGRDFFRWTMFATPFFLLSFVIGLPWGGRGVAGAYAAAMTILAAIYLKFALSRTTIPLGRVVGLFAPIYVIAIVSATFGHLTAARLQDEPLLVGLAASFAVSSLLYGLGGLLLLGVFTQYRALRDTLGSIATSVLGKDDGRKSLL